MGTHKVAILGTRYQDFALEEEAFAGLDVDIVAGDGGTAPAILDVARDAVVVLAGSRPRFDDKVLRELSCRGIVRYGVGTDSVDLASAEREGIAVARVSDYGTESVAFHAVTMALAQLRRVTEADRTVRDGGWGFAALRPLHEPSGLTAGIVGFGRIGRQVAAYLKGFGMSVVVHDPYVEPLPSDGVVAVELGQLLDASDVVLLHSPGHADGTPLLDSAALDRMRPGSVLVNTARGSLIDLDALAAALARGRPAQVALDVYPEEPPDLATLHEAGDRVLLSPHMAWYTEEAETDMRRKAAADAARLIRGEPLVDPVVEVGAYR